MEIGQINIDFQCITSGDPQRLLIGDFSNWLHIENKPSVIEITLPGSHNAISYNFVKHTINSFNSSTLYVGCSDCSEYVDLPDGIYTILLKGSPDTFNKQRYYLKIDKLRMELDKIYIETSLQYSQGDKEKRDALSIIEFYLRTAEAHTRRGNIGKAHQFFSEAEKLVNRNKKCTNCY